MRDSGLSDSQFLRFQKTVQKRMQKFSTRTEEEIRLKSLKQRFEKSKTKEEKTLWQKIISFFC